LISGDTIKISAAVARLEAVAQGEKLQQLLNIARENGMKTNSKLYMQSIE
jgi:hypothetical protein